MSQMEQYIEKWTGYLKAGDRDMSLLAAKKLAKASDPRSVEALIGALRGRPDDIRVAAVRSLGEIGDPTAVKPLTRLLDDNNPMIASAAADSLGAIAHDSAVPALVKVLRDYKSSGTHHEQIHGANRGLFMAAIFALERINTPEARRAVQQYHR